MTLKPPGSQSHVVLLTSGFWAVLMLAVLIGGHLALAMLLYNMFIGDEGMAAVAKFSDLPAWSLWLAIVAAIALDGWILFHRRKARKQALQR